MPRSPRLSLLALAILPLSACDGQPTTPADLTPAAGLSSDRCTNVEFAVHAELGLWMFNGTLVPGAAPAPVTLAAVDGWLGSVLTPSVTTHGRSQTVHWVLHHVFATDAPTLVDPGLGFPVLSVDLSTQSSWFITDDRAVCAAAGGGPLTCRVNDILEVSGGAGIFANADGLLHNHGLITITDPSTGAGFGEFHGRGRVCGDGL
jgi:hypothetical protein